LKIQKVGRKKNLKKKGVRKKKKSYDKLRNDSPSVNTTGSINPLSWKNIQVLLAGEGKKSLKGKIKKAGESKKKHAVGRIMAGQTRPMKPT